MANSTKYEESLYGLIKTSLCGEADNFEGVKWLAEAVITANFKRKENPAKYTEKELLLYLIHLGYDNVNPIVFKSRISYLLR